MFASTRVPPVPLFAWARLVVMGPSLFAGTRYGTIEAFREAPDFALVESDVQFRFLELVPFPGENHSTHILIEGLVPIAEGSKVLTSSYQGVDIADGDTFDIGQVILTLPADSTVSGASSAIVGIVARDTPPKRYDGWSAYESAPVASALGGASGWIDVDPRIDGTMHFSLEEGQLTGTADYTVTDESTIEVAAFSLTDAASSTIHTFAPMQMVQGPHDWYGLMLSTSAQLPGDYNSLMYALRIALHDEPKWGGYLFVRTPEQRWIHAEDWLGYLNLDNAPFAYHFDSDLWMYLPELEPEALGGWAYIYKRTNTPTPDAEGWGGYPVVGGEATEWIDARSNWLGHFTLGPGQFSYWLESDLWLFIPQEPAPEDNGAWIYVFKREGTSSRSRVSD